MLPHKYEYDGQGFVREYLPDVQIDTDQIVNLVNTLKEDVDRACKGTLMGSRAARSDLRKLRKLIDLHARLDRQLLDGIHYLVKESPKRSKLGLISKQRKDKYGRWIDKNTTWSDVWETQPPRKNKR